LIGAAGGIMAGVVLYLGFYYVGMIDDLGFAAAAQVQLFPKYLQLRKQVEVTRDAHAPRRDEDAPFRRTSGNTVMNWLTFGGELAFAVAFTGGIMYRRSRKPYCEGCRLWMTRGVTRFETDKGPSLVEALQNHSPPSLAALFAAAEYSSLPNTSVAVDYCPRLKEAALRDCPTYLSVKVLTMNPQGATLDAFDSAKGTLLAREVQLVPVELPALLSRFPMFQALTGHTPASALQQLGVKPEPSRVPTGVMAEVRPVPAEFAGRTLTKKTALIATSFVLGSLIAMFAGLGLAAWGSTMTFPDKNSRRVPSSVEKAVGNTLIGLGVATFFGIGATFFIDPSWLSNRYLLQRVKKEFARRGTHIVEPNDPSAMFVEVVPKLNWGKMNLESASDIGFLRLDKERREILFEGDKEYWRIPAAAITSCEIEMFVEGQGSHAATKLFYTVLRARHPGGFWEAPVRQRGGIGMMGAGKRRRWAEGLRRDILEMRGPV
jgi:hypothetical protein